MAEYMNNKQLAKEFLGSTLSEKKYNDTIESMVKVAKSMNNILPVSMLRMVAVYELANFISQFQYKVEYGTSAIPTNVIGLVLAKSGFGKDSSKNAIAQSLETGYAVVENERDRLYIEQAKKDAEASGSENVDEEFTRFMQKKFPLKNSLSTVEGLTTRLNKFQQDGIGMPSLYVGELGSELQTNPDIIGNIRLLSELYDLGNKESKAIKDQDRQDAEVHGMGMSALFVGSPSNLILDETILKKLQMEFVTKLARRAYFIYPKEEEYEHTSFNSFKDYLTTKRTSRASGSEEKVELNDMALTVAENAKDDQNRLISMNEETEELYEAYQLYCVEHKDDKFAYDSEQLHRMHAHWRALKLAGVFAVSKGHMYIFKEDLQEAITFTEDNLHYLHQFEIESNYEPYETMLAYLQANDVSLTAHDIKKHKWIKSQGKPDSQIQNLVDMANSKSGNKGMVKFDDGRVTYESFTEVEQFGASYIQITGSKEERIQRCHKGFAYKETTFDKLANILCNDTAFTPFGFIGGHRTNDNINTTANFIILDVDDTDVAWTEEHDNLGDFKHHIALTSDSNNIFKYRIILPLDIEVDLEPRVWKKFVLACAEYVGIEVDGASGTKSQIFFGYKDREVLSSLEGMHLPASEIIKTLDDDHEPVRAIHSETELNKAYDDRLNIFAYAYDAPVGTRSLVLFRAMCHAKDLGMSYEMNRHLIEDIADYWTEVPDNQEQYDKFMLSLEAQTKRKYNV